MPRPFLFLIGFLASFPALAQSLPQRVVSELQVTQSSQNPANYVFYDSLHYYYSSSYGSKYNYKDFCYNCGNRTVYTDPEFLYVEPLPNNIDIPHSPWSASDSSKRYFRPLVEDEAQLYTTQVIHYNPDSSVSDITRYRVGATPQDTAFGERSVHEWTGGKLSRVHYIQYDPRDAGWDTVTVRSIHYDPSGRVESDSIGIAWVTKYTYDAAGRWLTKKQVDFAATPPDTIRVDSNVYDPAGRLSLSFHSQANGMAPSGMAYSKDSFTYRAGFAEPVGQYMFSPDYYTGELTEYLYAVIVNRFNALGQIDSVTTYYGTLAALSPLTRAYRLRYNADGNPSSKEEWNPNSSSNWPAYITYYGYERYTPASQAGTGSQPSAPTLNVAPNPSSGDLVIRGSGIAPDARLQLSIRNTAGQLVRSDVFQLSGGSYRLNTGSELSPGIYLLRIIDAHGNEVHSGKIERR